MIKHARGIGPVAAKMKTLRVFLLAAMIVPMVGLAPAARVAPKAQPVLLQTAEKQPDQLLNVIIQKMGKDSTVESAVSSLGGKVTKDLHIINAIGAQMRAGAVKDIATLSGVRWISMDSPVKQATGPTTINTGALQNVYTKAVKATGVWNNTPNLIQGQNIGVAVVDSGVGGSPDFSQGNTGASRVVAAVKFNSNTSNMSDSYGHGTNVAGIVAGNGNASGGAFMGIAPWANIINVKVSDDVGASNASDVVNGLQWINDNKGRFNIKVVNLSLNQSSPESYTTNPIDAACEILWFNGITVVVSAGNAGPNALNPPANDPFVITVGAVDDQGTIALTDDTLPSFSSYGVTSDGVAKPDLVAPGVRIKGLLSSMNSVLAQAHPSAIVPGYSNKYFEMSGTSMAAPVVAGAVALMLSNNSNLTPDQIKYRLKISANHDLVAFPAYRQASMGSGYLNIQQAVKGTWALDSANTGLVASQLLWTGSTPVTWGSVNWNSVNWNSVNWNSVNWNSVNWNSVNWNSDWWTP